MKYLLVIGYVVASVAVLVGEYNAITKGHDFVNHLIWGGLAVWNSLVLVGFAKRTMWSCNMIKVGAYFQLLVILVGAIAYVTDIGFSMEFNNRNVTLAGSVIVVIWAVIKLKVVGNYYANT